MLRPAAGKLLFSDVMSVNSTFNETTTAGIHSLEGSSANFTKGTKLLPIEGWTAPAIINTVIFIVAILLNAIILGFFCLDRKLWIPFNLSLMLLMTSNIIYGSLHDSLEIISTVAGKGAIGFYGCTAFLYSQYISNGVIVQTHLLISATRMWALHGPMSYRQYFTYKTVFLSWLGGFLYCHIVQLPALVLDALYYRLPIQIYGCIYHGARNAWSLISFLMVFDIPILAILVAYPFIWFKRKKRNKTRAALRGAQQPSFPTGNGRANLRRHTQS